MADTVRLRNISGQAVHVAQLGDQLVDADATVDIPARLLHHQRACPGTVRTFVPERGDWDEGPCRGCLAWPEETWRVEADAAPKGKGESA